ncbi:TPM domain-containing protein [Spirulina subsalsa FACHB-351]|uniref:TPM domain-containing protein n=1 Tax=Spirulina subsalsa FACHB-351 TaxID=234711 RepID=A0ABT3LBY8_9CYAN|nr:TPM domain-containing protein [Spirulina subsalsa]MCW6039031.1 TPM domain-containing protein [Spirulina subsalsa FACHB-351]
MKTFVSKIAPKRAGLQGVLLTLCVVILSFGMALPALATGLYSFPTQPSSETWVFDNADEISRVSEGKVNKALSQLAQNTGNEVRFVVIRRLDYGETMEGLTDKLFEQWFPTPEARANQTLLVLDTLTKNTAIRVGEGLEDLLSDDIAQSVATETLQAPLREGNKFNQALLDASDRLLAVLSGEPDPGPPEIAQTLNVEGTFTAAEDTDARSATVWVVVLLIVATIIPMATYFAYVGFPGR